MVEKSFISRESARKSGKATSWLMQTMKSVAPRHTGMKNNTIKMHLLHHIGEDILDFGVPQNVNSAFAESAQIHLAKITSKNTQRRPETFTTSSGMLRGKSSHRMESHRKRTTSTSTAVKHRNRGMLMSICNMD